MAEQKEGGIVQKDLTVHVLKKHDTEYKKMSAFSSVYYSIMIFHWSSN